MTNAAADVILIGAGHNGLVCASYLAKAGRSVLVLESAAEPGGASVTREFAPGFKVSAVAHLLHLLDPRIEAELELARHGLAYARSGLRTVALSENGTPLILDGAAVLGGEVSAKDCAALASYAKRMHRFARLIGRQHRRIPPRLAFESWRAAWPAAAVGLDIRRLGRRDMREFLRVVTMNIFDVLEENFDSAQLKAALALDGVLGTKLGPRSGNSVYNALYRLSVPTAGESSPWRLPQSGMGSVGRALAAAAAANGVVIRYGARVESILVTAGRAAGVRLVSGEELHAPRIVSNADPKTSLLRLLGARHLETEFAQRVNHIRCIGTAAKLHLALDGLPSFRGLAVEQLGERLLIAPDLDYIERAFNPAKYRECSAEPILEISIPTIHDASLAPAGKQVLSAIVQYAPYDLAGGWQSGLETLRANTMALLERYAPGIGSRVLATELLSPLDIERQFGIAGGHWHHGELSLDQFLMLRPTYGSAQYATPVPGLYLCGAGCHPGGGIMGHAGRNAAEVVLKAAKSA